jgi:hypothetical protein
MTVVPVRYGMVTIPAAGINAVAAQEVVVEVYEYSSTSRYQVPYSFVTKIT